MFRGGSFQCALNLTSDFFIGDTCYFVVGHVTSKFIPTFSDKSSLQNLNLDISNSKVLRSVHMKNPDTWCYTRRISYISARYGKENLLFENSCNEIVRITRSDRSNSLPLLQVNIRSFSFFISSVVQVRQSSNIYILLKYLQIAHGTCKPFSTWPRPWIISNKPADHHVQFSFQLSEANICYPQVHMQMRSESTFFLSEFFFSIKIKAFFLHKNVFEQKRLV